MKHFNPIVLTVLLALGVQLKTYAQVEFVVPMTRGWNMISAPVIPDEPNTEVMFREIIRNGNLIIVKDGEGHFGVPDGIN
ncbi:MAG: hypothetical protein V2A61_00365, partial [Calditrichota bacterium]